MTTIQNKAQRFVDLHHGSDILVLPNAWDAASALMLSKLGYPALATTSAGIAFSRGYADGERISRVEAIEVVRMIARLVDIPVTADIEAGYGRDPAVVAETVRQVVEAGAVGVNLEDSTKGDEKDNGKPLFELELAVERYRAAREAADSKGLPFVLNARVDCYVCFGKGPHVASETIRRANAYVEAGANCVFVVDVTCPEDIRLLAKEIRAPLNVLAAPGLPSVQELRDLGVARLTLGSSLARAAYSEAARVARELLDQGVFALAPGIIKNQELNQLLSAAGRDSNPWTVSSA